MEKRKSDYESDRTHIELERYKHRKIKPDLSDCAIVDYVIGGTIWLGYVPIRAIKNFLDAFPGYEAGWEKDYPPRPIHQFVKKTKQIRKMSTKDLFMRATDGD